MKDLFVFLSLTVAPYLVAVLTMYLVKKYFKENN